MQQDPIDWRYLAYIRPIFQAYVRGDPNKIWPYMVQYLHFRILEFPFTIGGIQVLFIYMQILIYVYTGVRLLCCRKTADDLIAFS